MDVWDVNPYHTFILRCWEESGNTAPGQWRFLLQEVGDPHRRYWFTSLEEVISFLRARLNQATVRAPK